MVYNHRASQNWKSSGLISLIELTMESTKDRVQVLIIDDQPLVREGLISILTSVPEIEVIGEASSGMEGVELARRIRPDIALMDIEMPGELDGLAATRLLKASCTDCDVLMLTFHDGQEYLRQAIRSGASGYITKDMSRSELINAVLTVARGGSLVNPSMLRSFILDLAQDEQKNQSMAAKVHGPEIDLLAQLTRREREVLALIGEGMNNQAIAQKLTISQDTVKTHVRSILEKLGVNDRTQAAVLAVRIGLKSK
jgi:DNA-binding NarL/FixJ family response regulator